MSTLNIRVADDIRAALPAAVISRVLSDGAEFLCPACRVPGSAAAGDEVSVLLIRHTDADKLTMAHASCLDSQIVVTNTATPPADPEDDLVTLAALVPSAHGPRPFLFLERRMPSTALTMAGDVLDPWIAGLLQAGWQLLPALGRRPAPAPPGWACEISPTSGAGRVVGPEGQVLLDQLPDLPSGWAAVVLSEGTVSVAAGHLDLRAAVRDEGTPFGAVTRAARAGELVAASVPVRAVQDTSTERQRLSRGLAASLADVLSTRSRPGADDRLNAAPEVVPLPTRPVLHHVLVVVMPGLFVDLHDPDQARANATLAALEAVGIPRRRSWSGGPLTLMPEGWGYLLWPSQVFIMAGQSSDGGIRKLLFESFTPTPGWFDTVKSYETGGLALAIGNLHTDGIPDALVIEAAMAAGGVLAAAVWGMTA